MSRMHKVHKATEAAKKSAPPCPSANRASQSSLQSLLQTPLKSNHPQSNPPTLILASQSPNRIAALTMAGIPFSVMPSHINERELNDADPKKLVTKIAAAKAQSIACSLAAEKNYPLNSTNKVLVLAADTVGVLNSRILLKPDSLAEVRKTITSFSGAEFKAVTGICLISVTPQAASNAAPSAFQAASQKIRQKTDVLSIMFRKLTPADVQAYTQNNKKLFHFPGGFDPEEALKHRFITDIKGSFTHFMWALPFEVVIPLLVSEGFPLSPALAQRYT